ncbi:MAG: hypothetical protein AAF402_01770 [Pseudomonadota bacterium]
MIAVHGVADQPQFATLNATAALLSSVENGSRYDEFEERDIQIPLRDIPLGKRIKTKDSDAFIDRLNQTSEIDRSMEYSESIDFENGTRMQSGEFNPVEFEHESVRSQLQDFDASADDQLHSTQVVSCRRVNADGQCDHVDLFEMYWADLSRLGNGLFTAFFEFYLFMFLFPRIGGRSIERASRYSKHTGVWSTLLRTHLTAEFSLTILVPISYLCLLTLLVSGVPVLVEALSLEVWVPVFNAALISLFVFLVTCSAGRSVSPVFRAALFPLSLLIIWAVYRNVSFDYGSYRILVSLLWIGVAVGVIAICKSYEQRRPGALSVSWCLVPLTGVIFLAMLMYPDQGLKLIGVLDLFSDDIMNLLWKVSDEEAGGILVAGIGGFLVFGLVNVAAWLIFVVGTLLNSLCGLILSFTLKNREGTEAGNAIWTGVLSLVIPGLVVMLVSYSMWEVLYFGATKLIHSNHADLLRAMLDLNLFPHLPEIVFGLILALAFAVWVLSPGPVSDLILRRDGDTQRLGELIDHAFRGLRVSGEFYRWLLIIAVPLDWLYLVISQPPTGSVQRSVALAIGLGALVFFFGSKGPLRGLSLGFRAGLDVGLDVTNWLRMRPVNKNPRAAISRRFYSLLDYIGRWRDSENGRGYDQVVFVTHSQGTVITADCLRFRFRENTLSDEDSETSLYQHLPPLKLLTFGSPLRQLYRKRFPYHYHWVRDQNENGPDPTEFGLQHWWNLYCSGDYIGRYLWRDDYDPDRWSRDWSIGRDDRTREMCLGYGGHTRYWNGDFPHVSKSIDELLDR